MSDGRTYAQPCPSHCPDGPYKGAACCLLDGHIGSHVAYADGRPDFLESWDSTGAPGADAVDLTEMPPPPGS